MIRISDGKLLTGDEIAVKLSELGIDADAELVAQLQSRVRPDALRQGERSEPLHAAVDSAMQTMDVTDAMRRALEIIAVGDASEPRRVAAAALRETGLWLDEGELPAQTSRLRESEDGAQNVKLSGLTLTFSLPDSFGAGWDYTNSRLYGAGHAFAGSFERSETENFAHEALHRIAGLQTSALYVGTSCTVTFDVEKLEEADSILMRLQQVVDAFAERSERQITVRGSNYRDSLVTEYKADDYECEVVSDMPLRAYLARYIPLASKHPSLRDEKLQAVIAEYSGRADAVPVTRSGADGPDI